MAKDKNISPRHKFPDYFYNRVSYLGAFLSLIVLVIEFVLFGVDFLSNGGNPYLGILTYVCLPPFLIAGLILIPVGALWKKRRVEQGLAELKPKPFVFDFSNADQRNAAILFISGTVILLVMTSIGSYKAFNYTESVHFCGITCHEVMKPEHTTYLNSPHARVKCVECHIGPGADWYVRSKMSGLRQVYKTAVNTYDRPVQTPIKNLRPSNETCEQCHWPEKFFGAQQKSYTHYLSDEKNSAWQIQMLIRVGGGDPSVGATEGIHWHMNIANTIDYVASDEERETIPWVRSTDRNGKVTEYVSTENPMTPEQLAKVQPRRMDCIDCHNRPSHIFHAPNNSVEQAFIAGHLDASLPFLKQKAVELLTGKYLNEKAAEAAIKDGLVTYYRDKYPDIYKQKIPAVDQAAQEIFKIYKTNFFPEMKTDWRTHPDHLGHMTSDGCFRCHDGVHKSREGKVITNDCNACHTFLAQGSPLEVKTTPLLAQPFKHPVDIGVDISDQKCTVCHTGANQ